MLGLFQKIDSELYNELLKKTEVEFYDYLVNIEKDFLNKKSKTINKALKTKKWNIAYLMDCAANRTMLEIAEKSGAKIIRV